MVKRQVRLSEQNISKILEVVIPTYYKQYPVLRKKAELTKPDNIDDGIALLIKFWEDNW